MGYPFSVFNTFLQGWTFQKSEAIVWANFNAMAMGIIDEAMIVLGGRDLHCRTGCPDQQRIASNCSEESLMAEASSAMIKFASCHFPTSKKIMK
jgi:hypothetical protein